MSVEKKLQLKLLATLSQEQKEIGKGKQGSLFKRKELQKRRRKIEQKLNRLRKNEKS